MRKTVLAFCLAMLLVPLSVLADSHEEQPALSDVWQIVPKKGMENEFEEAVKAHMQFRAEAGESRNWWVFTPSISHNMSIYAFRSCCFNWADLDGFVTENQEKGFGEHWNANVHQYVDHYHHYVEKADWKNSHWPEDTDKGPYYGVTEWTWKEDAGPESGDAMEKMSQVALEEGWTDQAQWVWLDRTGGKPTKMIVISYENYADMEPPEQSFGKFLSEKIGEEEAAAVFSDFSSGFKSSQYSVYRYREDLSSPSSDDE